MRPGYFSQMRAVASNRRPVVVGGARTAFVRSFGAFSENDTLDLYSRVVDGLLRRTRVRAEDVDEVLCGAVVPQTKNQNVARDAVLNLGLPPHLHGVTLNRACTSSLQTIADAARTIMAGQSQAIIAGGVECLSDVPIVYSKSARKFLLKLSQARALGQRLAIAKTFSPKAWLPVPPTISEPLTGLTMGQHAEIMAKKNRIARGDQDRFAVSSHQKAAAARKGGVFRDEIVPVWTGRRFDVCVDEDNLIREDTSVEQLAKLRPAFDRKYGSLTAGNSSALTDGAAATLVMDEARAQELGLKARVRIRDCLFVGVNPYDQLLIGPALAIPLILRRNKLTLRDIGRFEIHEAFAAQVLSCLGALESAEFHQQYFGTSTPTGMIPLDRLNVNGGAIAIGHPFGATGARLVTTLTHELERSGTQLGLIAVCAAGGMAGAILLEQV